MNEKPPSAETTSLVPPGVNPEGGEENVRSLVAHYEALSAAGASSQEGGTAPEAISELDALVLDFEREFPLAELHAITSTAEALSSPLRQRAKVALIPILEKAKSSRDGAAMLKYQRLSQAVGMVTQSGVDHARTVG